MDKQKVREQLVLKRVGLEHVEQFNKLLRYVFQVTNEDIEKSGYEDGELLNSKRPLLERADVFAWFHKDNIVSQICIYPGKVNVHGRIFQMGGVTGVGTYPEFSGMGLMNDLITYSLSAMREKGQWISYLEPYSVPFYRHKGWEIMSDHITYTVKDYQLPKQVEVPGMVERLTIDHPDVINIYDRYARQTHGALIRKNTDWEEYWRWENEEERIAAVYYNEDGIPEGYVIYWINDDIFYIKEMIYLNQETRRGLWNFVSAHFSMIDEVRGHIYKNEPLAFSLEDSQIKEIIEPFYMARIVDVKLFLQEYPFVEFKQPYHFLVKDRQASWNNGVFSVIGQENGKNIISDQAYGPCIELDIQTLSALLMNYRRANYFAELERVTAEPLGIRLLENIIPRQQPYFSGYF